MVNSITTTHLSTSPPKNVKARKDSALITKRVSETLAAVKSPCNKVLMGRVQREISSSEEEAKRTRHVASANFHFSTEIEEGMERAIDKMQEKLQRLPLKNSWAVTKLLIRILVRIEEFFLSFFSLGLTRRASIEACLDELYQSLVPILKANEPNHIVDGFLLAKFENAVVAMFQETLLGRDKEAIEEITKEIQSVLRQRIHSKDCEIPDKYLLVGSLLLSALQKANGQNMLSSKESLTLEETLLPREAVVLYICSKDGEIREGKLGEVLRPGEWQFEAAPSLDADIIRCNAIVNGRVYANLKQLVNGLMELQVPQEKIGVIVSLFAQNTGNSLAGLMTKRFEEIFITPQRYVELNYDPTNKQLEFLTRYYFYHLNTDSLENLDSVLLPGKDTAGPHYRGCFTVDFELHGKLDEKPTTNLDSRLSVTEAISDSILKVYRPEMNSMKAIAHEMSQGSHPMSPVQRQAVAERIKLIEEQITQMRDLLKNLEALDDRIRKLSVSVKGLKIDAQGEIQYSHRGGKRVRGLKKNVISQIKQTQDKAQTLAKRLSAIASQCNKVGFNLASYPVKNISKIRRNMEEAENQLNLLNENYKKFSHLKIKHLDKDPSAVNLLKWARRLIELKIEKEE